MATNNRYGTHVAARARNKSRAISAPSDTSCYFALVFRATQSCDGKTRALKLTCRTIFVVFAFVAGKLTLFPAQSGMRLFELILTSALYPLPRDPAPTRFPERTEKIAAKDFASAKCLTTYTDYFVVDLDRLLSKKYLWKYTNWKDIFSVIRKRIFILNGQRRIFAKLYR